MTTKSYMWRGQGWHGLFLLLLLAGLWLSGYIPSRHAGSLWGISTDVWFWLSAVNAVAHQYYVWLCWRLELNGKRLSRALGKNAFTIYAVPFLALIALRPLLLLALAVANQGTLPITQPTVLIIGLLLLIPSLYLGYSVKRYFSLKRALGIDHFDPAHGSAPMVKQGIFRWSPNAMYVFGFMGLWAVAIGLASTAALIMALFSHLYIWVHYFCTEKPDMEVIYGEGEGAEK